MAERVILFLDSEGIPHEIDVTADSITTTQYTVTGGPVLAANLDMNNGDITDVDEISFTDPSTDGIVNAAGTIPADNIMAEIQENSMTTAGAILFPVISDTADEVDAFRVPALAGVPSATPADGGEGYLVWDSSGNSLYAWDGSAWDDLGIAEEAERVSNSYTADEALTATDALYISAADNVSKASAATSGASSRLIGFAASSVSDTSPVEVISEGVMDGFTFTTAGARIYLSATSGAVTETKPAASGNVIVQAGYAKSTGAGTSQLHIHIEQLGRLA